MDRRERPSHRPRMPYDLMPIHTLFDTQEKTLVHMLLEIKMLFGEGRLHTSVIFGG